MSRSERDPPAVDGPGTRLTLDLWHPDCWACEATDSVSGGVLAHAIYDAPMTDAEMEPVVGLFTAYGDTVDEVETLLDEIRNSRLTGSLLELQERFDHARRPTVPGKVAREFFLEYRPEDMICPTLVAYGFVHSAPCTIEDGRETWEVCYAGERAEVQPRLDVVEDETDADIRIASISTFETARRGQDRGADLLTESQRTVFELARDRGYYQWPRGVSTRELADELDVSKTTLLEHLRKAEAKLLNPDEGQPNVGP